MINCFSLTGLSSDFSHDLKQLFKIMKCHSSVSHKGLSETLPKLFRNMLIIYIFKKNLHCALKMLFRENWLTSKHRILINVYVFDH